MTLLDPGSGLRNVEGSGVVSLRSGRMLCAGLGVRRSERRQEAWTVKISCEDSEGTDSTGT